MAEEDRPISQEELAQWQQALERSERDLEILYRHRMTDPYGRAVLTQALSNIKYSIAAIGRVQRGLEARSERV